MKEHSIIFTAEEVRAYLDGRKTQVRRVIVPQPTASWDPRGRRYDTTVWRWQPKKGVDLNMEHFNASLLGHYCPYGQPGDRLWVQETFAVSCCYDSYPPRVLTAAASGPQIAYKAGGGFAFEFNERGRWRRSIHMPRWACRLTPDVTAVRVERVQEISIDDAIAEGVWLDPPDAHGFRSEVRLAFRELWDSINAKRGYGWDTNPWVWVVKFARREA